VRGGRCVGDGSTSLMQTKDAAYCLRRWGYRRFLTRLQRARHLPPLLWTFPGAGNTWLRMLLDYSTGIYTGSIYGDPSLIPLLPGEGRCDRSVVAVKAHPSHIDSFDFVSDGSGLLRFNVTRKPQYAKCEPLRFISAIVVVRDPYRSIWAEYKRHVNWRELVVGRPLGSESTSVMCRRALRSQSLHSGGMLRDCFDAPTFHRHALRLARSWKHIWFHYGRFRALQHARLLQVSYEDLTDASKRGAVLRGMVDFVGMQTRVTDEALRCAFTLADNPHIHRKVAGSGAQVASIDDAYANHTVVCLMWQLFRRKALKTGYRPFGNTDC